MAQKFEEFQLRDEPLPEPATAEALQEAQDRLGFPLPSLLCRLWLEVGNGGLALVTVWSV